MLSEENGFLPSAIVVITVPKQALRCSQENVMYVTVNYGFFKLYPVAFNIHSFKAKLDI